MNNKLEQLKKRAAERQSPAEHPESRADDARKWQEAEADLLCAFAIAEEYKSKYDAWTELQYLNQARADAKKLRRSLEHEHASRRGAGCEGDRCEVGKLLADTAHYEEGS